MTLHLAGSDGGEGSGEEGDDEMMLPIIFVCIVDQPIVRGWQGKIECLLADELDLFLGSRVRKRKKE
jgi:hypothetical protein